MAILRIDRRYAYSSRIRFFATFQSWTRGSIIWAIRSLDLIERSDRVATPRNTRCFDSWNDAATFRGMDAFTNTATVSPPSSRLVLFLSYFISKNRRIMGNVRNVTVSNFIEKESKSLANSFVTRIIGTSENYEPRRPRR